MQLDDVEYSSGKIEQAFEFARAQRVQLVERVQFIPEQQET